jgi:hypothetical protein
MTSRHGWRVATVFAGAIIVVREPFRAFGNHPRGNSDESHSQSAHRIYEVLRIVS